MIFIWAKQSCNEYETGLNGLGGLTRPLCLKDIFFGVWIPFERSAVKLNLNHSIL